MSLWSKIKRFMDPSIVTDAEFEKLLWDIFHRNLNQDGCVVQEGSWFIKGSYKCWVAKLSGASYFEINNVRGFSRKQYNMFKRELAKYMLKLTDPNAATWGPEDREITL